jgi:TP901 family phage tail tape measure protein
MVKITRNKVVEENIFGEVIAQGKDMLTVLVSNTVAAQKLHAETMKMSQAFDGSAKAQRELIALDIKSEQLVQQKIKSDQQIQKLEAESAKAKKAQIQAVAAYNKEKERGIKLAEKEAKAIREASSEYTKQSKRLNELRKEYKDLLLTQGQETAQMKIMRKEIIALDATLKKVDATVGQHQRSVGNYERALGGVRNMLGQLGLAFGVFTILKDVFNIVKNNEEAMASLAAITGLSGEEFEKFENKVNEVATELRVSSTEVAKAFELIASAQPALLKDADALAAVTEQAIILNKAIKGDLSETSLALVGVMNQFGESAEEAARIINILAAGSQAGAATVNQINESMVKFGTTAKIQNVSIEESVGLIETLGEKAIFGADAGTALRNILLNMSSIDALPPKALAALDKYGVNTDIVKDKTLSFEERLRELSKIAGDSTAIMQVFGKENTTAATVLLNSVDTYSKMTDAVTGTSVATEQAAVNSDTLSNILLELRAAWENLVVKWSEGTDVLGGLKSVLRFVADNLELIINWVVRGISVWASYRIALMLVNKEGTGFIQVIGNMIKGLAGANAGLKQVKVGFASWVGLAAALLPIMIDLVKQTWQMYDRTTALEKVTEKYNEQIESERAKMDVLRLRVLDAIGDKGKMLALTNEINATYGTTLTNIDDETQMMNQLWEAYQNVNAEMEKRIKGKLIEEELTELYKAKREAEKAQKELGERTLWNSPTWDLYSKALNQITSDISELNKEMFAMGLDATQGKGFGGAGKLGSKQVTEEIKNTTSEVKKLGDEVDRIYRKRVPLEGVDLSQFDPEGDNVYDYMSKVGGEAYQKYADIQRKIAEEEKRLAEEAQKRREEAIESLRDTIVQSSELLEEFGQRAIDSIDRQIEKIDEAVDASKSREDQLREEAQKRGLDADEAITLERDRQKALLADKAAMERKKMEIESLLIMLRAFAASVENGQGNPVANIKSQVAELISFSKNLPGFIDGTETTLDKAMKQNIPGSGNDKYMIKADGKERILNPSLSSLIPSHVTNKELVQSYLFSKAGQRIQSSYENNVSSSAGKAVFYDNSDVVSAINTLPAKMPKSDSMFDSVLGAFVYLEKHGNKATKYIAPIRKRW